MITFGPIVVVRKYNIEWYVEDYNVEIECRDWSKSCPKVVIMLI
jgi:hypothetical protein